MRAPRHANAAEEHAVFHRALDDAAVRHQRIDHLRAGQIPRGRLVARLGVHRVRAEQLVPHGGVEQIHVHAVIRLDGGNLAAVALELIALHAHHAVSHIALQNVAHQVVLSVRQRLIRQMHQQRALDDHHVREHVGIAHGVGVDFNVVHPAVRVHAQKRPRGGGGGRMIERQRVVARVHHGHVRAGIHVFLNHVVKTGVENRVPAAQKHQLLLGAAQVVHVRAQRVQNARIRAVSVAPEHGKQEQAVVARVQIPRLSGLQVIHQRMVIALHQNAHVADAAVHHAGNQKVHQPIARRHRQRRHRALARQLAQAQLLARSVNDAHYVLHIKHPPSAYRPTPARRV